MKQILSRLYLLAYDAFELLPRCELRERALLWAIQHAAENTDWGTIPPETDNERNRPF